MHTYFIDKEIKYIGSQLAPHWIYKNYNLQGDAIVSFLGEADVQITEMVDIEDVINNEPIYSKRMVHFIIERFNISLEQMVVEQRLFISIIKDVLFEYGANVKREGDDLYFDNRKLSVSIATKSITSCLIHTALNIIKEGAPVAAADLSELGIKDFTEFSKRVMEKFATEVNSIKSAVYKVRGVV